jgi:ubiquinone/menaquinone biosynthesis C-methylase UbiE
LEPTLNEVYRVLRPGGQLVCFEEPCIPDNVDEKAYMAQWCKQELGLGIDERRPCMGKYVSALVAFRMITFFSSKGGWPIPAVSRHEGIGIQAFK